MKNTTAITTKTKAAMLCAILLASYAVGWYGTGVMLEIGAKQIEMGQ